MKASKTFTIALSVSLMHSVSCNASWFSRVFNSDGDSGAIVYETSSGFGLSVGGGSGFKVKASVNDEYSICYPVYKTSGMVTVGNLKTKSSFEITANSNKKSSDATIRINFPVVESKKISTSRVGYLKFQKDLNNENLLNVTVSADYFICIGENTIAYHTKI